MTSACAPPSGGRQFKRVVGTYTAGKPGPTVLFLAGVHGNEPAGVDALERVVHRLREERPRVCGDVLAVTGNLAALQGGQRFVARDLNRQWLASQLAELRSRDPAVDDSEDREQRELLEVFDDRVESAEGPVVCVDLHTSSADGPPFCCLGDTLVNRHIAMALSIPVILGLEETIDGAVLDYFNERGLAGLAIEGGKHDLPSTVDNLEAAIWLVLVATGVMAAADLPDYQACRRRLVGASNGAPHVVEIRRHHRIVPADEFAMEPGFVSFQRVASGQLLARDRRGEIRATEDGRVLLPLYQRQGEDGFFLCRDVLPIWLRVARWLRGVRLGVLLPWLPGVQRHPTRPDALLVDSGVARWRVRELFHLLGYRRCRVEGERLLFTRRRVTARTRQLPWRR